MESNYIPYPELPDISTTGDTCTYIVSIPNKNSIELKFESNELLPKESINELPSEQRQQVDSLERKLIKANLNGTEDESESEEIEPFDPNDITITKRVVTMETILRRMEQGTIWLNPGFQRKEVWSEDKKCQLIESLLLRIPIPMFYISVDSNDKWTVVDGLQRLSSIRDFALGKKYLEDKENNKSLKGCGFKLHGLEFCGSLLNGKTLNDLPTVFYNRLVETEFTFVLINPGTPEEVKRNIFKRINTGGESLSPQEIRNALYEGTATKLLSELCNEEIFKKATCWSVRSDRMEDRELVLRWLAFTLRSYNTYNRAYSTDTWLSDTMIILNSFPNLDTKDIKRMLNRNKSIDISSIMVLQITEIKERFKLSMTRSHQLFKEHAFRKSVPGQRRCPINKALFETWGVLLSELNEEAYQKLLSQKSVFFKEYGDYLDDYSFIVTISKDSMSKTSVINRFTKIKSLIEKYTV